MKEELSLKDRLELLAIGEHTKVDFLEYFDKLKPMLRKLAIEEAEVFLNKITGLDNLEAYIKYFDYNDKEEEPIIVEAFNKHKKKIPGKTYETISFDTSLNGKLVFKQDEEEIIFKPQERLKDLIDLLISVEKEKPTQANKQATANKKEPNQLIQTEQEEETNEIDFDIDPYPFKNNKIKILFDEYIVKYKNDSLRMDLSYIYHLFQSNKFFKLEKGESLTYKTITQYIKNSNHKEELKYVIDAIEQKKGLYTHKQSEKISSKGHIRIMKHFNLIN